MVKKINWKNRSVTFSEKGSGRTVFFLHGFTESSVIWDYISESLSEFYRVICVDLPGHGESDSTGEIHTMDEMAECVNEIAGDSAGCVIIGHSMGGYVALAYAEKYPEKVSGLGLFHSSALADSEVKKADRLRTAEAVKQDKRKFIGELIPKLYAASNRLKMNGSIEKMKIECGKTSSEGIVAALLGMRERPDRSHVLKNCNCPVLFVAGRFDELIPLEVILPQTMVPKKSLTVILQNSGHMGFAEEPEESLTILKQFCNLCYSA